MKHNRLFPLVLWCGVLVCIGALSQELWGAPLGKIICQGNRLFSIAEVQERLALGTAPDTSGVAMEERVRTLLEAYRAHGYLWARASWEWQTTPGTDRMDLHLTIFEGGPTRIGTVQIQGATLWSADEARRRLGLKTGGRYDAQRLEDGVQALIGHYADRGYPFTAIVVESLVAAGDSLHILLTVTEGPLAVVREITVQGNTVTRRNVVVRELGIKPGQPYNQARSESGEARLRKLGLFKQVTVNPEALDSSGGALRLAVDVIEGAMNDITGVAGFVPAENGQSGYLTGRFDFAVRNLFGTGRVVNARWEKLDRRSVDLRFRYEEPWVLGTPVRTGLEFEQLHQEKDNGLFTYARTRTGVFAGVPFGGYFNGAVTCFREEIVPDSAARIYIEPARIWGLTVGLHYDGRNQPLNPSAGSAFDMGVEYNYHTGAPDQERYLLGVEHYVPLASRQVAAFRWRGRLLQNPGAATGYQEFFELGGGSSVRGYREGQFYGSKVTWINVEYKYFVDRRSSVYLFLDDGYYYRPDWGSVSTEAEGNILGYGFGGFFDTRAGALKLEYGLGMNDQPTDGKIHVKWGSSF